MDFGINNKIALVQGASTGLGFAAAEELAREGCRVAICSRSRTNIDKAVASIKAKTSAEVIGFACDVSDESARQHMLEEINNVSLK